METEVYKILAGALMVLISIVGFFCALGIKYLVRMANDMTLIKIDLGKQLVKNEELERRLERLEA